ncbi:hypothetical protein JMJ35_000518 [Cladonia borealis]|uniref:Transcription initiation factor TFIID subunit 8 n=1 Tax=Cladonia borealis TaxID=184061 RepID=A0AA39V5M2_9LECA|nr:hypothetical protein JMJ35_000518 [Cladonia borealis]
MAPMAVYSSHPLKRTSSTADFDTPAAKKLNRGPFRHHRALWDLQREQRLNTLWQDQEAAQSMLTRSIGLALHAVGFEAADPVAIESFRCDVEEYMAHYLADVRQSMHACRRTQPLPQDFLQALHTHQLSLRSLLPHLDPPVPPSQSQFFLESEPKDNDEQQQLKFLGPLLNGTQEQNAKKFVPKHFPDLPSTHTYKATPEFPEREQDPRKVRERATEEGRLGEEALRRLVGAGSRHPAHVLQQRRGNQSLRAKRAQIWMETMQAVEAPASNAMDTDDGIFTGKGKQKEGDPDISFSGDSRLSSAVNSEKRYWRKPGSQKREASGSI